MRFVADVHLGMLARMLRMLGIDTAYGNQFSNVDLLHLADKENRILLSRNRGIAKKTTVSFFWIESENADQQMLQVLNDLGLKKRLFPFSRCLICNGILIKQKKETIAALLEENTRQYYDDFWQCSSCGKIYWKGSHYERMQKMLKQLNLGGT